MTLPEGSSVGPYDIVAPLGAGGMGEVYRAHDTRLNRDVALKVLPAALSQDVDRLARFKREAQAAGRLTHPNIVAVYEYGEDEQSAFIAMEMVEGRGLNDVLVAGVPLAPASRRGRSRHSCWTHWTSPMGWAWCTGTSSPRT